MKRVHVLNSKKSIEQLLNEAVPSGRIHRKDKESMIRFTQSVKRFLLDNEFGFTFATNDEETLVYLVAGEDEPGTVRSSSNQKASSLTALLDHVYHTDQSAENYHPLTNSYSIEYSGMDEDVYTWLITPQEEIPERTVDPGRVEQAAAALAQWRASQKAEASEEIQFEQPTESVQE